MTRFYRIWMLLLAIALVGGATTLAAPPYDGRITTDQVFTRSGPGQNYYPTCYLDKNTIVEVYQEDGDWLAIRPTKGEFSLIRAHDLSFGSDRRFATVEAADASSYVGSQISDKHHVVHVKLNRNEPVEVLGISEVRDPDSGKKQSFYRISPPAGEFRWINKHFVEKVSPEPAPTPVRADRAAISEAVREADFWSGKSKTSGIQIVSFDEEASTAGAQITGQVEAMENRPPAADMDLVELELAISQECLKPADQWQFKPLKAQAKRLIEEGDSPLARGKARLLAEKVEEFDALYERILAAKDSESTMPKPVGVSYLDDKKFGQIGQSNDPAAKFVSEGLDPRYDGRGWLMPVITRASAQRNSNQYTPPFALTDSQGNVLQFVSPAPGLNLRRYGRMQVGIYGQISPLNQFTKPHLTAHRVIVLDRHEKK